MRFATMIGVLAAAACAGTLYSQTKPDFSGNWKLNAQKSDFGTDPAPESLAVKVDHKNDHLKFVTDGMAGGQPFHDEMDVAIDGKEHPGPADFPGTVTMKWDGPALIWLMKSTDGAFVMNATVRMSGDGKVITREVQRKSPEGESKHKEVYEKQ